MKRQHCPVRYLNKPSRVYVDNYHHFTENFDFTKCFSGTTTTTKASSSTTTATTKTTTTATATTTTGSSGQHGVYVQFPAKVMKYLRLCQPLGGTTISRNKLLFKFLQRTLHASFYPWSNPIPNEILE
jgi:hypothetical protein